ncbi:MAG: hypothetical protein LBK59_03035 [Bifidobacteriaceae bacterium]|nr:hypothetical protein [Bifidobacteriaceae bacterium]
MFYSTIARRALVAVSSVALAASALAAASPAAFADDPLKLGDLQVQPASGQIDPNDKTVGWLTSLDTNVGQVCPAGFHDRSNLHAIINGTLRSTATASAMRAGIEYPGNSAGVNDGETSIHREGIYVSNTTNSFPWNLTVLDWTVGATLEMRVTCQAAAVYAPATDPYYAAAIEVEPGGAWHVVAAQAPTPADTAEADINVVVPQAEQPPTPPEGLKLTAKPGDVTLTSADQRVDGQVWQATGTLGTTTVDDDRQDADADDWSLTGQASSFSDGGTETIAAANLGWTPTKVSGQGTAGAAIAPNASGGLGASQTFATGQASDSAHVATSLTADLALDVPAATPAGTYAATLTLTLI